MDFINYIYDLEATDYVPRAPYETNANEGTKNRSRERQTRDNIINFALNDIFHFELPTYADDYELRQFKGLSYKEQLSILLHILRIQAYSMRKAIEHKSSIVVPYIGRYTYNKYRELSFNIFRRLRKIENIENINFIIKNTLRDLQRTERRDKRKDRLSIREKTYPFISLNESGRKIDIIDERYNEFSR
jgi:hypothetical protein